MDIPIYENKLPIIDENVLVVFTEYKNTHIEAELIEYNLINGMMIYEDATRKKKVYDWKKEIPLNTVMVAKVEEIFSDNYVKLSTAYFDNKMEPIELKKQLMKPFSDNKIIIIIIKKLCKNNNLNFNEFWEKVIYKIINIKRNDDINSSLLDFITCNEYLLLDTIKENYLENYELIIDDYKKNMLNKNYKIQSKFSLIAQDTIEDSKELLKFTCENNKEFNFTLKYEATPIFLLESSSESSTQENHDMFLQFIEDNAKKYNVNYAKIN